MTSEQIENVITANSDQCAEYMYQVISHAKTIFENAGVPDDFCIQHFGAIAIVFGGRNRLIWTAANGFRPDRSYCDPEFLEKWNS